jgi:hypothetical protein
MGLYFCLAEILVGKTGVPGEKTTARGEKGFNSLTLWRMKEEHLCAESEGAAQTSKLKKSQTFLLRNSIHFY